MRWIIRIAAVIAVLVVLGLGALVAVPTDRVATLVSERIGAATGREVVMAGEVRPTLWPSLGIRVGDVRVGNPDWVEEGPLLAAERLDVSVAWGPLLRGEIRVERAEFVGPDITLVREADGRVSWAMAPDAAPAPDASDADADDTPRAFAIGFDRAEIRDGRVRWIDRAAGRDVTAADLDAVLALPSPTAAAALELSADVDGTALTAELVVDGVAPLLEGAVRPLRGRLGWPGGDVTLDGVVSLAPAIDVRIDVDVDDPAPLAAIAGTAMPDLPKGLGRDSIAASGQLTLTDTGSLHLRDGTVELDGNALALAIDVLQGTERPTIRATVSGGALALAGATGAEGREPEGGASASTGWSTDPIDVSALSALDAEVSLRLASVDLGLADLGAVEVNAALDAGRLVLSIGRIEAYGGRLAGEVVINGRDGLSLGGDLIVAGVQLSPLLLEFAGTDRLEGTGNASLQFLGVGNDVATIMAGLEGQGDFAFGAGQILGFDLAGMIRNFDTSFRGEGARTVYDSITANFTIENGVLRNDDLSLVAPWGGVDGEGTVNLGGRSLDYRVVPGVLRGEDGQGGLSVPLLVTGPWARPDVRPDLESLAAQQLGEQRDRIEGEVRDRANELLGTGLQAGDGEEAIGEALQERLSEETENVLSRLLGGGGGATDE